MDQIWIIYGSYMDQIWIKYGSYMDQILTYCEWDDVIKTDLQEEGWAGHGLD
jgi:hypothetical protein